MARQQYRTATDQEAARQESALLRLQLRQMAEDVRGALAHEPTRRLLWVFLQTMGLDDSPFNTNAMAQSRAIGRTEAAQWWLRAIRDNCPERESQMRAEANAAMKRLQSQLQHTEEGNDD